MSKIEPRIRHKLKISNLEDHIGFWLRRVSNHVSYAFAKKLENSGVTVAEWVVLREMYEKEDSTSPSTIASLTGLTRGSISKLIERLLNKELVTRTESSKDRRYQDIKLTNDAQILVPKLAMFAEENDEDFFSVLNLTEKNMLMSILKKISNLNKLKKIPIE